VGSSVVLRSAFLERPSFDEVLIEKEDLLQFNHVAEIPAVVDVRIMEVFEFEPHGPSEPAPVKPKDFLVGWLVSVVHTELVGLQAKNELPAPAIGCGRIDGIPSRWS